MLIAYQMTGPKIMRLRALAKKYPKVQIASLVDNLISAHEIANCFGQEDLIAKVYLDVDNGLHRTGCPLDETTFKLVKDLSKIEHLSFEGLHVYDGQFRSNDVQARQKSSDLAFEPVFKLVDQIKSKLGLSIEIVNGGSPSFSAAAMREKVYCSPGTVLLWDAGYAEIVPELDLKWAAVLMTRVISKPAKGIITVDLGHKSVSAENPIQNRIRFLNLSNYEPYKHSEEHLMIKVADWDSVSVGQVLYGIPFHVCPSVALHDEAHIIENNKWGKNWEVRARKRRLTV